MRKTVLLFIIAAIVSSCISRQSSTERELIEEKYSLITERATEETKSLYWKLASMQGKAALFGNHLTNLVGRDFQDWNHSQNLNDVKNSLGVYPALFGFEFARGYSRMLPGVIAAAKQGGVVTISHHMDNPYMDGNDSYVVDRERRDVSTVLPGGENHDFLKAQLDSIAIFASRAVLDGKKIPIIYRPWHEHTGNWFWWGSGSCTSKEYVALWRFTVEYLRDVKGVDNFIYAYSPSRPKEFGGYEVRNPGADYIDIVGFDNYLTDKDYSLPEMVESAEMTVRYAQKHNKVPAYTEFGRRESIHQTDNSEFFTESLIEAIFENPIANQLVYVMTWRSAGHIPQSGELTHPDFVKFYNHPYTYFLDEWKAYE